MSVVTFSRFQLAPLAIQIMRGKGRNSALCKIKNEIFFIEKDKKNEIWSNKTDVDVWHWGFLPLEGSVMECSIYSHRHSPSFIKEPGTSSLNLLEGTAYLWMKTHIYWDNALQFKIFCPAFQSFQKDGAVLEFM